MSKKILSYLNIVGKLYEKYMEDVKKIDVNECA